MLVCPECGDSSEEQVECDKDKAQRLPSGNDEYLGKELAPYRLARLVGQGGMGRVYLGVHSEIGSRVAIKIFSRDWDTRADLVERFFAEAKATNVIQHENIINVMDVGRLESGRPFLVMEFLRGLPLSALIGKKKLDIQSSTLIILDVLSGLAAAHKHLIIHRDLKPDNIFVSPKGRATLLDFGVAKLVPDAFGESGPTTTGTILGTPHYMSPEQAVGDPIDHRTDIYAIGIILFECCVGRRPFEGTSLYRLLDQHIQAEPPLPSSLVDIDPDLEAVILKALEKQPKNRFQSAKEMLAALELCAEKMLLSTQKRLTISSEDEELNYAAQIQAQAMVTSASESGASGANPSFAGAMGNVTAATIGELPSHKNIAKDPSAPKRRGALMAAFFVVGGLAAGLAVAFAIGAFKTEEPEAKDPSGLTNLASLPIDGAPEDVLVFDAAIPDAAIPDAAIPDAAPVVRRPKVRGIAPLTLLKRARPVATAKWPDAMLVKIGIEGIQKNGRIDLSENRASVFFDFFSLNRAQKQKSFRTNTKRHSCLYRVSFSGAGAKISGTVKSTECDKVSLVPPTKCTMRKFLRNFFGEKYSGLQDDARYTLYYSKTISAVRPRWYMDAPRFRQYIPPC